MTNIPKANWKCGNCGHYIEDGPPPSHKYMTWNCSRGNPTPEHANRGPCMHWYLKTLTDKDY